MSAMTAPVADPLVERLATDRDCAFEEIVQVYQGRLYSFAFRFGGDRRDAEEIVQDAFIRAYRALCDYDAARIRALALRPWLYQITLNVARNHARRRTLPTTPLDAGSDDGATAHERTLTDDEARRPEQEAERFETSATLARLVLDLPPRYRAAVILRHIEGLTYPEVAAALDQPLGTIKANIHRGVRLLRQGWATAHAEEGN